MLTIAPSAQVASRDFFINLPLDSQAGIKGGLGALFGFGVASPTPLDSHLRENDGSLAPHSSRDDAYRDFIARGSALIEPQFGSVFGHVGSDALDLLHRLTTNSILDLPNGSARRTVLTNEKGRITDVIWVFKRSDKELLLVSDAPDASPMRNGIERFTIIEDAELNDLNDFLKRWYLIGPGTEGVIRELLPELDFSDTEIGSIRGMDIVDGGVVLALRTDAAGPQSWLIMAAEAAVPEVASRFASADLQPASNELFDFVRIKNQVPIVGKELTEDVNPLEAGLIDLIDFDKGCYVGQEVIARLDTYDKVQRVLVGFTQIVRREDERFVSPGERISSPDGGRDVGWVTSVANDPKNDELIGMSYLRKAYCESGTQLTTSEGSVIKVLPNA